MGFTSPKGDGVFGHADLGGNIWEWILDWRNPTYPNPCVDCVDLRVTTQRGNRGGGFYSPTDYLLTSFRGEKAPHAREDIQGFRCAAPP